MSMDVEVYASVLHRVAEADHGWGKPYAFPAWYVLDHAVPGVDHPRADLDDMLSEHRLDEALRSALRAKSADLPVLTFVQSFHEVYDAHRRGPIQMRNGGAFVAFGPNHGDPHTAIVGVLFYGGHRWARWTRYHLERTDDTWQVASSEELAVS